MQSMSLNHHSEIPSTTSKPWIRPETPPRTSIRLMNFRPTVLVTTPAEKSLQNQVRVMFADSAQSFLAPQGATLGQIATRINELSARRERNAVAVTVKFTAAPAQVPAQGLMVDAFRKALLAETPRLRAFAMSIARNSDRADDLVQTTLTKGWANRSKFEYGTNLRAWLFTILRNIYFSELRSRRREVADADGYHASQLTTPAAQLHYMELQDVARALVGLTSAQKNALFLVAISGESYDDAASICGCATGTIKSRVFRARKILSRYVNG
jgi:RNA polymerase sigma-70 factor (ECF subfamily)